MIDAAGHWIQQAQAALLGALLLAFAKEAGAFDRPRN